MLLIKQERKVNIKNAIANIMAEILASVSQNMVKRIDEYIQNNGGHFQLVL
jgi:hypothetical protein